MKITRKRKKHLGAAIGHTNFREEFVTALVKEWAAEIEDLSAIASFEQQAAYTAFTQVV